MTMGLKVEDVDQLHEMMNGKSYRVVKTFSGLVTKVVVKDFKAMRKDTMVYQRIIGRSVPIVTLESLKPAPPPPLPVVMDGFIVNASGRPIKVEETGAELRKIQSLAQDIALKQLDDEGYRVMKVNRYWSYYESQFSDDGKSGHLYYNPKSGVFATHVYIESSEYDGYDLVLVTFENYKKGVRNVDWSIIEYNQSEAKSEEVPEDMMVLF